MTLAPGVRPLLRLGVGTLLVFAASALWELFAAQAPGTPLAIDMLAGPVAALRELALTMGVLTLGAAALLPIAWPERPPKWFVALLSAGTVLALAAQSYAAAHGMFGVQCFDLRPDALPLFVAKHLGLVLFSGPLLELARRILRRVPGE